MKNIILIVILLVAGCSSGEDDWVFGGARKKARMAEEQHQCLMKLYDLQTKMMEAKLSGDSNITDADLAAINTSINEIKAQQQQQKTQQILQGIKNELKTNKH